MASLVLIVLTILVLVVLKGTLWLPADNNEFVYPSPETLGSKQNLRQQKERRPPSIGPRQNGPQNVQLVSIPTFET